MKTARTETHPSHKASLPDKHFDPTDLRFRTVSYMKEESV